MFIFRILKSLAFIILSILLLSLAANQPVKQIEVTSIKQDLLANSDSVNEVMTITVNLDSVWAVNYSKGYRLGLVNDTVSIQNILLLKLLPSNIIQQIMLNSFEEGAQAGLTDSRKKLESK